MRTILRWLGILLGILVGLAVLLSVALALFVDVEDYRDDIAAAVSESTGRTLLIDGPLSLRSFPCCGIEIGDVTLSNPPDFPSENFLTVESANVGVQLIPLLLRQELLLDELSLDGFDIQLIARKDGAVNWDFATASSTADGGNDAIGETEADATAGAGLTALDISGIQLSNGRLVYFDESQGEPLELRELNLTTDQIQLGEAFQLTGTLTAAGLLEATDIDLDIDTEVAIDYLQLDCCDGFLSGPPHEVRSSALFGARAHFVCRSRQKASAFRRSPY